MKVYQINTAFTHGQRHCVVAYSFGSAERVFLKKYPGTTISSIELIYQYVEIEESRDADQ